MLLYNIILCKRGKVIPVVNYNLQRYFNQSGLFGAPGGMPYLAVECSFCGDGCSYPLSQAVSIYCGHGGLFYSCLCLLYFQASFKN